MNKHLTTLLLCLASLTLQAQDYDWARQIGGQAYDQAQCLATDKEGNVYVAGTFEDLAFLGEDTLKATWFKDVFIAKFDSLGTLVWKLAAEGPSADVVSDLSIDEEGNVYLTGIFKHWIAFDNKVLKDAEDSDIFLVKISKHGEVLWANQEGGAGFDGGYAVACHKEFVYLLGTFTHLPGQEATGALEEEKGNHLFLAKYGNDGTLIWVKPTYGNGKIFGNALVVGNDGMVFLTGSYSGKVRFSKDSLPDTAGIFLAKYNGDGDVLGTSKLFQEGIRGFGSDLAINEEGGLFLAGALSIDSLGEKKVKTSPYDIYVCKINVNSLREEWVYTAGGKGSDKAMGLAVFKKSVYLTGWYTGRCSIGEDTTLTAFEGNDLFWAKFSTEGDLLKIDSPIQKGLGYGKSMAVDPKGNFYWSGWFTGVLNMPSDLLFSKGKADLFLTRFRDTN